MSENDQSSRNLAGQLVVGLEGVWPTEVEWAWLKHWQPGGVILFSRNVENFSQLKQLCSVLREAAPGLQIMADHEGGPVSQMAAAVGRPPVAFGLGVLDDIDLTCRVHEETGRRLKAAGLDWVLAPCADVLSEARNPVIGARSFGSDAELVARHVAAAVKGLGQAGISCCLKHWPGHGSSSTDSHLESTVVQISDQDELPFRVGLEAGAEAIMPGHLITSHDSWPATLSKEFLDHTRRKLATGEIQLIADDISMGALREAMARLGVATSGEGMVDVSSLPRAWFEHLARAGCDLFLIRGLPLGAFPVENPGLSLPLMQPVSLGETAGFSPAPYDEARQSDGLTEFTSASGTLLSLDLARNDRWQVAGGQNDQHWEQWGGLWAERFGEVLRASDLDYSIGEDRSISWLLVTNHRPMPKNWTKSPWAESLRRRMKASGRCLVMGHPSLQGDFEDLLGAGWAVTALYDVSCDELV